MNESYICSKRKQLVAILAACTIISSNFGYLIGYRAGVDEASAQVSLMPIPVTTIQAPIQKEEIAEVEPTVVEETLPLTDAEIDLIALITMAEAEGESDLGKRLVVSVILNRVDSGKFPNSIRGVIYDRGQFECVTNGRLNRCYVRDDIRKLVVEEVRNRTRNDILYFRAGYYHGFGKPVVQEGNHYFSTI